MHINPILLTDSYKQTHHLQYRPHTTEVYSYLESRGGMFPATTWMGSQYYSYEYLLRRITAADIDEAEEICGLHFGRTDLFNRTGWEHILNTYGGALPLRIKAVPEGTTVPTRNVLMTATNTDPKCFWLTNFAETLLVMTWYMTTVCTLSREIKKLILAYLHRTGDPAGIDFKLHDFGFRGVSSVESAGIGGISHLVNFLGTDTMQALVVGREYYDCPCAGYSIPAAEHSTMTSWGRARERDAYENMIKQFGNGGTGHYAVVSDSYDLWNAAENIWGNDLKAQVMGAENTLVVRPDSGVPEEIVPKLMAILSAKFGSAINSKGYRVLNNKVRVIQGDGMDYDGIGRVLKAMTFQGWSTDNIAFGQGGGLLQKLHRDTQRFAFKCSSIAISDPGVPTYDQDVYKDPATDPSKVSKAGKLKLIRSDHTGAYCTVRLDGNDPQPDELVTVYENGECSPKVSLDTIRARAIIRDSELPIIAHQNPYETAKD